MVDSSKLTAYAIEFLMGALTFQPASALLERFNDNSTQPGAPASQATNPSPAQNGADPQDTVILASDGAETQFTGDGFNGSQFQQTALFYTAQQIFLGQNNQDANASPQPLQAHPNPAQAPGAPQQSAAGGVNAANDPAPSPSGSTPQQELQTLDQTLQELGINPQSITLFNRLSLLLYANNPAALRVLVQSIQGGAQNSAQAGNATTASSQASSSSFQPQASVQAPPLSAGNGADDSAAQAALAQPQTNSQQSAETQSSSSNSQGSSAAQLAAAADQSQDSQGQTVDTTA
jgi:hypothetical protein